MIEDEKRSILKQLRTIRGHINGIEKMVEEEKNCPDVLIQVAAVTGSMKKLQLILNKHMAEQCIEKAITEGKDLKLEMAKILDNISKYK